MNEGNQKNEIEKYFQPLDESEIDILKKNRAIPPFFMICIIIFLGVFIWMGLYMDYLFIKVSATVIDLLFSGVFIYSIYKRRKLINHDIRNKQKIVYEGKVESKRENSTGYNSSYYFSVLGIELETPFHEWKKITVNQIVKIHFAPKSKYIFKITPVNSPLFPVR